MPARKDEHPPVQLQKPLEADPQSHLTPRPQHHALWSFSSVLKANVPFVISENLGEEEKLNMTSHVTNIHTTLPIQYAVLYVQLQT